MPKEIVARAPIAIVLQRLIPRANMVMPTASGVAMPTRVSNPIMTASVLPRPPGKNEKDPIDMLKPKIPMAVHGVISIPKNMTIR